MDAEVAKAINNVSKRLNEVESRLDQFFMEKHNESTKSIETTDGGLVEVADLVSAHDDAIVELAELIATNMEV